MPKNTKIVSLSLQPELHKLLKKEAQKRGKNVSELIRYILNKFPIQNEDVQLVVLQVPKDIVGKKEELTTWFDNKFKILVDKLSELK